MTDRPVKVQVGECFQDGRYIITPFAQRQNRRRIFVRAIDRGALEERQGRLESLAQILTTISNHPVILVELNTDFRTPRSSGQPDGVIHLLHPKANVGIKCESSHASAFAFLSASLNDLQRGGVSGLRGFRVGF